MTEERKVIRCPWRNCHIYKRPQYMTVSGLCRCCHRELKPKPVEKVAPKPEPIPAPAPSFKGISAGVAIVMRYLREERGMSQREFGKHVGVVRTYVSRLENGVLSPTVRTVERIAAAFNITPYGLIRMAEEVVAHNA